MTDDQSPALTADQDARATALARAAAVLPHPRDVSPIDLHSLARYIVEGGDPYVVEATLVHEPEDDDLRTFGDDPEAPTFPGPREERASS